MPSSVSFLPPLGKSLSALGRAGPPGPPLSREEGPPGRSNGVTCFCSGFLPHVPPSTSSLWPGLVGIRLATHSRGSQGPGRSPPSPHPPWAAPSLPEALGSALHGPHSHPHPAASPGLLGQGIPDRLRVCVDRASDRSEGLLGCPPGSCSSVAQSCLTLCNPMDCSMPGFPVLHHLARQWFPEFPGSLSQE